MCIRPPSPTVLERVSPNLALRTSPERLYGPKKLILPGCPCSPSRICTICNYYPCRCCVACHCLPCKCVAPCITNPCVSSCSVCHFRPCRCCRICHCLPCRCCPLCHCNPCICCGTCRSFPCKCCPICHDSPCKCCSICHSCPCRCCPVCHLLPCKCCPVCHCLPCKCCSVCHCLPCRCCITCHCNPCVCITRSPVRCCSPCRSPVICHSPCISPRCASPIKISSCLTSNICCLSPSKICTPCTTPCCNPCTTCCNAFTPCTTPCVKPCSPCNPNAFEEAQFNDFLKKLMIAESQIEAEKINLALCPDFNCEDAFRIFEVDGRGFLDPDNLKCGLNLIGLCPTDQEIRLLMKRFDLQKQGCINFADFFDILVPFEKEYREMVEGRTPNSCCPLRCSDAFCCSTLARLRNLFNLIINFENDINNSRKCFSSLRVKLPSIFCLIDCCKSGCFNNSDLSCYLKKNCLFSCTKDCDLLFIRLDKNRNGQVLYANVEDEVQPGF